MRILVIGGTRFTGPYLVRQLVAAGHNVTVFHRGQSSAGLPASVGTIHGDRNRLADHTAAIRDSDPEVIVDMYLLTEAQASELTAVADGVARRIVVASSCDVYLQYDLLRGVENSPPDECPVTEESPLRPKLYPYRDSVRNPDDPMHDYDKIQVERTIMSHDNVVGACLRLPMIYGPHDYQHRFWGYIKRMQDKRPAIILEEGQADWRGARGYVENCAHALYLAATDNRAANRIYNVAEADAPTERQWIEHIARILDWPGEIVTVAPDILPKHRRSGLSWQHHLNVDSSRLREELDYAEPVDRDTALRRTIDWELANPPAQTADPFDYPEEDRILSNLK